MDLQFETVSNPPAALRDFLWEQLKAHGLAQLSSQDLSENASLANLARYDGEIVGATLGNIFYLGYNLQLLWVREDFRGQGLGMRLLEAAEAQARGRRCTVIFGFSFGFQAPDFYRRAGYTVFGTIEEYPRGSSCYFLRKYLT